jgi:hypothetical protein
MAVILSCSRRTDIPAFYSDWFFNRLREGFVLVRNPMNARQVRRISLLPAEVDGIVFWTKDPAPMLDKLPRLGDYTYYVQFTLTPYGRDIEPHLPPKDGLADTFLRLADRIGAQKVVWRYDPILLSESMTPAYHAEQFDRLARRLAGSTEKCVISFLDLYRHIRSRTADLSVRPPDEPEMRTLAQNIMDSARRCNMTVKTCAEKIDLACWGIGHGRCVDDRLLSALSGRQIAVGKDKFQRDLCGCAASVDIGDYNTCGHLCAYCYANRSRDRVAENRRRHDDQSPLLIGRSDESPELPNETPS